ncbi:hypothetical protein BP5796_12427 [Coleophoma crateriformis]|uniref:Uncharacterized protein n=1 Tax=Coleophoma crateriformis TaxID=565419 RepID=A0A3D8QA06_9HELO|nr:hypothetical protein BP5796_12427 [Coleophoma crateriformis]
MSKYFKWAELPPREDVYTHVGTTRWGNHDLYPIPAKEKKFNWISYFCYTIVCGVNITDYSLGSTYIALGLTATETIGCIIAASTVAGIISYVTARPGLDHGIGFTMWVRSVFGLWGSYIPLFFIAIAGCIFSGLQSYYGGLAFAVMLGAIIPQFAFMSNTLPESAATTTKNLIAFLCFFLLYVPLIWLLKPYQMRSYLYPGFVLVLAVMFGMLIWAIHGNGGSAGTLWSSNPIVLSASDRAFRIAQCLITVIGTWGGASERFSDWSRFAKSRQAPTLALVLGTPLGISFAATIGALVTSAYYESHGKLVWNPLTILATLQLEEYTPSVRAGTFFAGLALLLCQCVVNICNNTIGWSMDLTGALPKYVSMKRAALLQCAIVIVLQPWRFLSQAYIFVEVLSVNSIFLSASSAIVASDYYIIRRRKLVIPDLYVGNDSGIYWYTRGINWRAVVALALAMWPSIPGLGYSIKSEYNTWTRIFQINYVVAAPIGALSYLAFCFFISMPRGLGVQVDLDEQRVEVIDSISAANSVEESSGEKTEEPAVTEV